MTETIKPKREPWTHERFMRLASEVFNNKYTYELPEKILSSTKIKAYCPEHDQYFWPNPNDHFRKRTGCPQCGDDKHPGNGLKERGPLASLEKLVGLLKEVHGDKYDYSQVTLPNNTKETIRVICPKEGHGVFTPSVVNHLYAKTICFKCSREARTIHPKVETPEELRRYKWTPERFYEEATAIHGDKFEYELPEELKASAKVRARCRIHDVWFTPNIGDHIYKESGCPECKVDTMSAAVRARGICADVETFVKAAREAHGDRYDYSRVVLRGTGDAVEVVCNVDGHGSFFPSPTNHAHAGTGCPACAGRESLAEIQIRDLLQEFGIRVIHGHRLSGGLEVDLYCPDQGVGFEHDGLLWHDEDHRSSEYHRMKDRVALEEGIRLFHVYEDDWAFNRDRVVHALLGKVGVYEDEVDANECVANIIDWSTAEAFLEAHHIRGASRSSDLSLGLFHKVGGVLVGVLCLSCDDGGDGSVSISRFCTSGLVVGGFEKLLRAFLNIKPPELLKIRAVSHTNWDDEDILERNGFTLEGEEDPDYYWVKRLDRYARGDFERNVMPIISETFDPEKSNDDNCRAKGYRKLYDSGKTLWVLDLA